MTETITMKASVPVSALDEFKAHMNETYGETSHTIAFTTFAEDLAELYKSKPEKYKDLCVMPYIHFTNSEMATFFKLTHGHKMVFESEKV